MQVCCLLTKVVVENLGDDLPVPADEDQGQEIREKFRSDCTLGAHKGGDWARELDRDNSIASRFVAAGRRRTSLYKHEVFVHAEILKGAIGRADVMRHGVENTGEFGRVAVI